MKTLVVVGHPALADSSTQPFLKALSQDLALWHPLAAPFDPQHERQALWQADRIILQFPLYWYSVPAIMKQWLDEIFDDALLGPDHTRLVGKELGVVVSLGRPEDEFGAGQKQGFTIDEYLRPLQGLAQATGMGWLPPLVISQFAYQTAAQRQGLAVAYQQYLTLPQPSRFADRVQWLATRLDQLAQQVTAPKERQKLVQLRAVLLAQQAELDDLTANLRLVRETEEF